MPIRTTLFDYHLPQHAIAKYPPKIRGRSKLLVLYTNPFKVEHRRYYHIPEYIQKEDVVVLNNTKVIKARLFAKVPDKGAEVEVLLLNPTQPFKLHSDEWEVLIGKAKKLKNRKELIFPDGSTAQVVERTPHRTFILRFSKPALEIAHKLGRIPIPKYLKREDEKIDYERYNTVFAQVEGSVAAPTASLNLTPSILKEIQSKAHIAYVTLYIGWGTFAPVDTEYVEDFKIHKETAILPEETVKIIQKAKNRGNHIFAFGTTVTRTLEGVATKLGKLAPYQGEIDLYIYPGYQFKVIDRLITNFHAPKSSVLILVSAFAGLENIKKAYKIALQKGYKFLSYGDSMLIIPQ